MLEELNRLSDYIADLLEGKKSELTGQTNTKLTDNMSTSSISANNLITNERLILYNSAGAYNAYDSAEGKPAEGSPGDHKPGGETNTKVSPTETGEPGTTKKAEANRGLGFTHENHLHKEVFDMLEKGMTCDEIAKKLNRGKGEVQLIIDMKKYY